MFGDSTVHNDDGFFNQLAKENFKRPETAYDDLYDSNKILSKMDVINMLTKRIFDFDKINSVMENTLKEINEGVVTTEELHINKINDKLYLLYIVEQSSNSRNYEEIIKIAKKIVKQKNEKGYFITGYDPFHEAKNVPTFEISNGFIVDISPDGSYEEVVEGISHRDVINNEEQSTGGRVILANPHKFINDLCEELKTIVETKSFVINFKSKNPIIEQFCKYCIEDSRKD